VVKAEIGAPLNATAHYAAVLPPFAASGRGQNRRHTVQNGMSQAAPIGLARRNAEVGWRTENRQRFLLKCSSYRLSASSANIGYSLHQ
jgi:hypothetical protein